MESKEKLNSVEELSKLLNIPISVSQAIKNWIDEKEMITNKLIEELQSQLAGKDKEIYKLKDECGDLSSILVLTESELTSLKEKHKHTKQDVIDAFNSGYTDCEIDNNISDKRSVSEFSNASDYYTQTHEKE